MKQKLLILILAFSPLIGLFAQTGTITGRVTDSQSDKAIPAVTVKVATQQTVTDAEGKFKLDGINFGDVMVEFSGDGYLIIIKQVNITGDIELGTIKMTPTLGSGAQSGGLSEVNIGSLDSDDESNVQDISGLLSSSDDVFSSIASYYFRPAVFQKTGI